MIKNRKEILFPHFLIHSEKESPFWKPIFEDLSYGIYPHSLSEKIIIYLQNSERIEEIKKIIKEPKSYLENEWKNIRKKNVKRALIENYCISTTDTIEEAKELLNKISLNDVKIIYKNSKIENIIFNL